MTHPNPTSTGPSAQRQLILPWVAMAVIAVLAASRCFDLLLTPRFWVEEGSVYYVYALTHSWLDALLAPQRDYYSLICNITALISAKLLPMRFAPAVTTYTSFICLLLPHAVIWFGQCYFWNSTGKKALASALILFVSQPCGIWLTIISVQFHFCVLTFLILLEEWEGRSRRCLMLYGAMLFVTTLSGVVSCLLLPLFLFRAWADRTRYSVIFAGLFVLAGVMHTGVTLWLSAHEPMVHHVSRLGTRQLPSALAKQSLRTLFLGHNSGFYAGRALPVWLSLGLLVPFIGYFTYRLHPPMSRVFFLGSCLLYYACGLFFLNSEVDAPRYFYAGNVVLMLMVLQGLHFTRQPSGMPLPAGPHAWAAALCLLVVLATGISDYYGNYYCYNESWPRWREEVAQWRKHPQMPIALHPAFGWNRFYLNPRAIR